MANNRKLSGSQVISNGYVLIILIGVFLIFSLFSEGRFVSSGSIVNILRISVPVLLISTVATLLMITGNVDLSVGGQLGLCACVFALMMQYGIPFYAGVVIVALLGCLLGFINGFLVMKLNITPVIATLGTMSLFLGIGRLLLQPGLDMIRENMPKDMGFFSRGNFFLNLPPSVYLAVAVIIIFIILQKKTTLGKYSVAIGGNKTAARLSGIDVVKTVWVIYVLIGLVSGLAGVTRASYMLAGDPKSGIGIEVEVIIAILLGGASFSGGKGSIIQTVIAVFIMISLNTGLIMIGVASYWGTLVNGLVFIGALSVLKIFQDRKTPLLNPSR